MTDAPTLSVVVPTKNRHPYLAKLIQRLLMMESHDFEVVVHDNSEDRTRYDDLCGGITDCRLRYFFAPEPMSITENCERGIMLARGLYVCMIGDDDGVTDSIVDVARWMHTVGVDAAVATVPVYLWPGVRSKLDGNQTQGVLRLPRYSGRIRIIDESAELQRVLSNGGTSIADMPSVYQGVISRRALDDLRARAGTYFPGPSPDMANAVGLSAVINRFAKIDLPIVISGLCPSSGAAEGARHGHEGEIEDRRFLAADTGATWPNEVPYYFSGPTMYASSLVRALQATQRTHVLRQLRLDRLYAACVVLNPKYRDRVAEARAKSRTLVSAPALYFAVAWIWWQRAKALARNLWQKAESSIRDDRRAVGLPDIGAAVDYVTSRFSRQQFRELANGGVRENCGSQP